MDQRAESKVSQLTKDAIFLRVGILCFEFSKTRDENGNHYCTDEEV